ncbi:dolichyl-phosphate beta-glucosyltransferase [Ereboglobus luteus]|uniref:dolichyl-phosphate beta-glucosyltransferase n=1 Tax=Ereboglobus luteus TaxID=1796921 RepID=A0A2U8E4N8_9BACT|nr:dolichyl-phosphate beta-glucosyltransferase [Ereboglobus luteus]AWI09908.1 hypothetical protein CKA38_12195 [Ereboglobus luteus]
MHLSIVIPAYNETRRLASAMQKLAAVLETFSFSHEVLLVVEKSGDDSLALAQKIAAAHPNWRAIDNLVHRGKGYAVRSGMLRATGDFICFMDADLSSDPAAVNDALKVIETTSATVVAGNRRHPESVVTHNQGKSRPLLSKVFNLTARMLFPGGIKVRDTQCGFKMFRADAAREIFTRARIDGFAFDIEIFLLAHRLGYEVRTIPVHWTDSPYSTVRAFRHGLQMYRDLLRLRFRM